MGPFLFGEGGGDSRVTLCDGFWRWHANRAVGYGCYGGFIGRDWFDPREPVPKLNAGAVWGPFCLVIAPPIVVATYSRLIKPRACVVRTPDLP